MKVRLQQMNPKRNTVSAKQTSERKETFTVFSCHLTFQGSFLIMLVADKPTTIHEEYFC